MSKTIVVAHQKGGVGKSTLALNLAYRFSQEMKIALTDTDPQGTLIRLKNIASGLNIMTHDEAKKNNKKYDVILVDTPPYLSEKIPTIFSEADFVLIPTKAGVPDVMAIDATIKLFKEAQKNNNKLLGGIILNMVKPRTSLTFFAKEQLYAYNIPILGQIGDRVAFNNTFLSGGIFTSEDSQAKQEIELLATEILNVLK